MREIEKFSRQEQNKRGLLVLSASGSGASEILRRNYDRMFGEQGSIIPIYFAFSRSDRTVERSARRFLQTFLLQTVAFRRENWEMLNTAPELREIAELAVPSDGHWIDRLIISAESEANDERNFTRQCFSAPLRAAANGAVPLVIFDDFQQAEYLEGKISLVEEFKQIFVNSTVPFIVGGRRRQILATLQSGDNALFNADVLRVGELSDADAGELTEDLARRFGVEISEQARDLIVQQVGANTTFINALLLAARDRQTPLKSFHEVQRLYVEELIGGRIARYFQTLFDEIVPNPERQREILQLLFETQNSDSNSTPLDYWKKRISASPDEFYTIMRGLHIQEILRLNSSVVEGSDESGVLGDYVRARYATEIGSRPRGLVIAQTLAESLKRAPQLMARFYRRSAAIGLKEILSAFNCQKVPEIIFDYETFREKYRGAEDEQVRRSLAADENTTVLLQTVYVAECAEFYPAIQQIADVERCAVALAYENGVYDDASEIYILAAEVESKLEVSYETAEFWLDRLEAVAVFGSFQRSRIWLVTNEGFSPEALKLMSERGAVGSNRTQIQNLAHALELSEILQKAAPNKSFELVLPMGDDTELIAAQAVEEIAKRYQFQPSAINQIKTALVEASINAAEHSLSPDRKIYQRFAIEDDKLVITVANRGISFRPNDDVSDVVEDEKTSNTRRGWGIKLMKKLMDEVSFERRDDGTQIKMVKYMTKEAV